MSRNGKFALGSALLVLSVAYLVYAGVQTGSTYYLTVSEFAGRRDAVSGERLRIAGRVAAGSVVRRTTAGGTDLRFVLQDFPGRGSGPEAATVPVEYHGIVPDMFAEGRDVIVEGRFRDGRFEARTIMTSCPSKYEPASAERQGRGAARGAS